MSRPASERLLACVSSAPAGYVCVPLRWDEHPRRPPRLGDRPRLRLPVTSQAIKKIYDHNFLLMRLIACDYRAFPQSLERPASAELSRLMMGAWSAFIISGDPNGVSGMPGWERYDGRATVRQSRSWFAAGTFWPVDASRSLCRTRFFLAINLQYGSISFCR